MHFWFCSLGAVGQTRSTGRLASVKGLIVLVGLFRGKHLNFGVQLLNKLCSMCDAL